MKLTQKFKDIQAPEDVDPSALSAYTAGIYEGQDSFDIKAKDGDEFLYDTAAGFAEYTRQANLAIDKLKEVTSLRKFDELKKHFPGNYDTRVMNGGSRNVMATIKDVAETLCYRLEPLKGSIPQNFQDKVKNSSLDKCTAGAATNMQDILYSLSPSYFYQKYAFIKNTAAAYMQETKLASPGTEVHVGNELMHEISREYNVAPDKDDVHARYRDLDTVPQGPGSLEKHYEFRAYLDNLLKGRNGVYSFIDAISTEALADFPDEKTSMTDAYAIINGMKSRFNIDYPGHIIGYKEDGDYMEEWAYKDDYVARIKMGLMAKLQSDELMEHTPLIVGNTTVFEIPDGWYLEVAKDHGELAYEKLLETSKIHGLTVNEIAIEDFLHEEMKKPLADGLDFKAALREVVKKKEASFGEKPASDRSTAEELADIKIDLTLLSDQARPLRGLMKVEEIYALSAPEMKGWGDFFSLPEQPALLYAITHNSTKKLEKYCELFGKTDADLASWRDENGNSILHLASKEGGTEIVKLLIEKNFNIRAKNQGGDTALAIAMFYNQLENAEILVEAGARIAVNDVIIDDLAAAAANGHTRRLMVGLAATRTLPSEVLNTNGETALHIAAKNGRTKTVEALRSTMTNMNIKDVLGYTALHHAAACGHHKVINKLIRFGINVNAKTPQQETPLHLCVNADQTHLAAISALIEAGADLDIKDESGLTALHYAARKQDAQIVQILLENGANPNAASAINPLETPASIRPELFNDQAIMGYLMNVINKDNIKEMVTGLENIIKHYPQHKCMAIDAAADPQQTLLTYVAGVNATLAANMIVLGFEHKPQAPTKGILERAMLALQGQRDNRAKVAKAIGGEIEKLFHRLLIIERASTRASNTANRSSNRSWTARVAGARDNDHDNDPARI